MIKNKNKNNIKGLLIYTLILFFDIVGFVYALHSEVLENKNQVTNIGGTTENKEDGIKISKTIEETDLENYFDITLKVKTQEKIEEIMRDPDLAIVLVIDVSNTMIQYNLDGSKNTYTNDQYIPGNSNDNTRYAAAIQAGEKLINKFVEYSQNTNSNVTRKMGIVAFNTDAHTISSLADCKSTANAKSLISNLKTQTENIVGQAGYNSSKKRFTNMEAGLNLANSMLNGAGNLDNKVIIFLTDGLPTTYIESGNTGYDPYDGKSAESSTGKFYDEINQLHCTYGTSYSDLAAIKAREKAQAIKNTGTKIYSVGTGINYQKTVPVYIEEAKAMKNDSEVTDKYSLVDVDKETYENNGNTFETGNNTEDFKNWLKNEIGSNEYFDTTDKKGSLEDAFKDIFEKITSSIDSSSQASWVVEDPMGTNGNIENIEFVAFLDDKEVLKNSLTNGNTNESDTAEIKSGNKIRWDLKDSSYQETKEGNTTYYEYSIKYRVRLKNELNSFSEETIYNTNGTTKLTYVTRKNGVLSNTKEIEFKIPKVVGYLGQLTFTKKSNAFDNIPSTELENAEFELTHDPNCPCLTHSKTNDKHMDSSKKYTAKSDEKGQVTFSNIPSGHKYILKETKSPENYTGDSKTYNITVAYGNTTGGPKDNTIYNDILTGNLKITKEVIGNNNYKGNFEFKLTVTYNKTTLTNSYKYSLYDSSKNETSTGTIKLTDTIKLADGDYIIIKGLPIGAKYEIKEITTNGYVVKHKINNSDEISGATASCTKDNCSIKNDTTQTVNFYNIAGYILPETGSCGMLILIITSLVFVLVPVINIAYTFLRKKER